jgi:Raf kinase inhibitor-like YbhB/YbcL family protein
MLKTLLLGLLRNVHAGEKHLAWNDPAVSSAPNTIVLTSDDFEGGGAIPIQFAGKGVGQNISPSLKWSNIPANTVELVLVMEDPDAPWPRPFVHLVAAGISPSMTGLPVGALSKDAVSLGITLGTGTLARPGYSGPRAPEGFGPHRYIIEIFALSKKLDVTGPPKLSELLPKMDKSVVGKGKLEGIFEQKPPVA